MDDAQIVSLLQQIVDGLSSVEAAIDDNTAKAENGIAWLGEKLDDIRSEITECRERVDMEGSHVQDRLNEVKAILDSLPSSIAMEMN